MMPGDKTQIKVFPIKQRYKNLSKSQLLSLTIVVGFGVSYKTKIQKFKQITTHVWLSSCPRTVFPIKQRYKNLSKSQQLPFLTIGDN